MASVKLLALFALLVTVLACASAAPRFFILDDGEVDAQQLVRVRRDNVAAGSEAYGNSYKNKGHVGPVYTFVKTDPKANFKWGVRHRVGAQYAS